MGMKYKASKYVEQNPDSKIFTAGIDAIRNYNGKEEFHLSAIEFHHKNKEEAIALRDKVLQDMLKWE